MSLNVFKRVHRPWTDPLCVARSLSTRPGAVALLAGGGDPTAHGGRWSYVACEPDHTQTVPVASEEPFAILRSEVLSCGAVIGLMSYDAGARPATGARPMVWPDLMVGRYPALLAFDHRDKVVEILAWGHDAADADHEITRADQWLDQAMEGEAPSAPARDFTALTSAPAYEAAVADVVSRIAAGELFQANIARTWAGQLLPDRDPFEVFERLSMQGGAAYGAFWRMADRALVSNSPELFLTYDPATSRIETRPIKGTRARAADALADQALTEDLINSAKDRAENLMIVDLMRNDLARAAVPGSVEVERLFEVEHHPTVHHLVSTVAAKACPQVGVAEVLEATFPPGSITGAPKHQAMKVIAGHEEPRGPWCGSLFGVNLNGDGGLTASVLIRTASFEQGKEGWSWQARAGAGIVADSDPVSERLETETKILALQQALINSPYI